MHGPDTCGSQMRMGKCGWKNAERIKREMRMAKINKQTNKGKKSFFQVSVAWLGPSCTELVVNSWPRLLRVFLNSLNPVIPFINVTETRTLRSSSLKPRMLWCTSPLSTQPGYSVLNQQKRKYSLGNQIENCLFERLETKKRSVKKEKGGTQVRNFPIWQMPMNSAYRVNLFLTSSNFWEFVSARNMNSNFKTVKYTAD